MQNICFFDCYKDKSGTWESLVDDSLVSGNSKLSFSQRSVVCFDARKAFSLGLSKDRFCYDIKLLYKHDGELSKLVKSKKLNCSQEFFERESVFSAHTRAISEAKMDIQHNSLKDLVPDSVRVPYLRTRMKAISELWYKLTDKDIENYEKMVWPVFLNLLKVEDSKIAIDENFIDQTLKNGCDEVHVRKFLEHTKSLTVDGFTKTKINPVGSRTWRYRVESGFNCMAIPHGLPRKAVVSRFNDGRIVTLDFNAIDYRCLIKAVNDATLNSIYEGQSDFHSVTAAFLQDIEDARNVAKKTTYASIYGGSVESLMKLTLLPREKMVSNLRILDEKFRSISEFRKHLAAESRKNGFLITPGGHKVEVFNDDHDGKIIGLFAQTYSSSILNKALDIALSILADCRSKIIFTVHDEIVIDCHPQELHLMNIVIEEVLKQTGFLMKRKEGKNYDEATN